MKSVIRQMFLEEKGSCQSINPSENYNETRNEIIEYENKFKEWIKSNQELFELYSKISDTTTTLISETETTHYVEGFKLGILLGLELLKD